jgi:hypothetical protein
MFILNCVMLKGSLHYCPGIIDLIQSLKVSSFLGKWTTDLCCMDLTSNWRLLVYLTVVFQLSVTPCVRQVAVHLGTSRCALSVCE